MRYLIIIFIFLLNSCNSNRKGEIHILPDGFMGPVVIVYGVTGSPLLPLVGEYYIYNIPDSRIIYTSTQANDGSVSINKLVFFTKRMMVL